MYFLDNNDKIRTKQLPYLKPLYFLSGDYDYWTVETGESVQLTHSSSIARSSVLEQMCSPYGFHVTRFNFNHVHTLVTTLCIQIWSKNEKTSLETVKKFLDSCRSNRTHRWLELIIFLPVFTFFYLYSLLSTNNENLNFK